MWVCVYLNIQSITCIMRVTFVTWNLKLVTRIMWIKLHRIGGSSITRHMCRCSGFILLLYNV